jgi:hypothetical protein
MRLHHRPSTKRYHPFFTLFFLDSASIHQAAPLHERFRKGISLPSRVPYVVNMGSTDGRLNLRTMGSVEEDDPDFGWDFSGLRDPSAMRDFMSACDYCLSGCPDDGHSLGDEGYDPSRDCFHIDHRDHNEDNHLGMPEDDNAPVPASRVEIPRELAVVPVPAGGQDTQLEQLREMQAKLDDEAGQLVQLQQNIEQGWAGRALAGGARHRARDVQRCIFDDAREGLPPAFSGADQNLAVAAMLLRTMLEPFTTEGRCIQGELKDLLEDAAVRRAESSASQRRGCPSERHAASSRRIKGGLGLHRAHTGRDACSPGSPRRRATPPRLSNPPRGKGAPRLQSQARRMLRQ